MYEILFQPYSIYVAICYSLQQTYRTFNSMCALYVCYVWGCALHEVRIWYSCIVNFIVLMYKRFETEIRVLLGSHYRNKICHNIEYSCYTKLSSFIFSFRLRVDTWHHFLYFPSFVIFNILHFTYTSHIPSFTRKHKNYVGNFNLIKN